MNVEKLQRMNELAKELKEHGLANSMEDAYKEADKIMDQGSFIQIRSMLTEKTPEIVAAADVKASGNQLTEVNEKLNTHSSKIEQMGATMMKMQEVMNDMIAEMLKLKEQRSLQNTVVEVQKPAQAPAVEAPKFTPREQPAAAAPSATPGSSTRGMYAEKSEGNLHPRQGQYTPGDVSIEKFFHVGNMKR